MEVVVNEVDRVDLVLQGRASYDDLADVEQAVVRAAWDTRETACIAALDFTVDCPHCGLAYAAWSPGCLGHTPRP
jgi:hypothetical protein